ncbi:MAG: DUF4339 domain-containing protein, partial [Planctomycetota bacterium]
MGEWYCVVKGTRRGPISLESLRQYLREGRLEAADLVWTEGMANWTPAAQVPELSQDAPGEPVPVDRPASAGPPPLPAQAGLGRRPGGLTALAVLNFVFGAANFFWRGIGVAAVDESRRSGGTFRGWMPIGRDAPSAESVYLAYGIGLVAALLEILAAVGYLGRKKLLGYFIGNAFAVVAIIYGILAIIVFWSVFHTYGIVFSGGGL